MTETEAAPVCYRHSDRETYVRCTRCDRPICPECMREAAVGFQCPECVREGNKSVRQARTVFGGKVTAEARATKVLIAINVVAFVAQLASARVDLDYGMVGMPVYLNHEYYRFLTSAFLHSRDFPLHIAMNMYALLIFGQALERILGTFRFVVLYLVAAIGASVATYIWLNPYVLSLGASGAIAGLFGAYFVAARRLRADTSQLVTLFAINVVLGFVFHGVINNYAHGGGLVTGAALAFVWTRVPRGKSQTALQLGFAAVLVAVLAVVSVLRTDRFHQHPPTPPRSESMATAWSTGTPRR